MKSCVYCDLVLDQISVEEDIQWWYWTLVSWSDKSDYMFLEEISSHTFIICQYHNSCCHYYTSATGHVKEKHTKLHVSACISALYNVACHWVLPVCVYCHYLTLHTTAIFILCVAIMYLFSTQPVQLSGAWHWLSGKMNKEKTIETADLPQMEGTWLS